jgi:heme/copper-type cytochrome/quinol oxidase subunit 4
MSSNNDSHAEGHHPASYYIRIYWILFGLLILSILGPLNAGIFGNFAKAIVMITAYGVAFVKAYIVAAKFMHLDIEKKYITLLLLMCLLAMFVCFGALAPDIMNPNGANWENHNPFMTTAPEMHYPTK